MNYYLISTSHLKDDIWFRDEDDFKVGMNYVAVLANERTVFVLCFVLMSNHVHFVVACDAEDQARAFITKYKNLYARYYRNRYGKKEFLRRNQVNIRKLEIEDESLLRGIAYTLMNPPAANICQHASQYPWGSGGCYFRQEQPSGSLLGEKSWREQCRLLHSKSHIHPEYCLSPSGYVLPDSYVSIGFVEKLFRKPGRLNYFLRSSSKARAKREAGTNLIPTFRDQLVVAAIPDICNTLFEKSEIDMLTEREKARLVAELHRRFSSDTKQVARLTGFGEKDIIHWLEDF